MKFFLHLNLLVLFLFVNFSCTNKSEINNPETADEVAHAIEKAIHKGDWDRTQWVQWNFGGHRAHLWDRQRGFDEIEWNGFRALINIQTKQGRVFENGEEVKGATLDSLLAKAWSSFINDAFWLNAPAKLFDEGTMRSLLDCDGHICLKVEYTSGGVTPGDYYIWHFDENYLPTSWDMYVSVIPTPGTKATWEKWITLESGALIAPYHQREKGALIMENVKSGNSYKDFGRKEDPFAGL